MPDNGALSPPNGKKRARKREDGEPRGTEPPLLYHPRADSSLRIFTEICEKIIYIVANRTIS